MDLCSWFPRDVGETILKVDWIFDPFEVAVELTDVAVVAVSPGFAVVTVFEAS